MIAVIGDIILDRWIYGHFSKISAEGTPVFKVERTVESPGGAANVAVNVAALGAEARLIGIIGDDHRGHRVRVLSQQAGVRVHTVGASRQTPLKIRAVGCPRFDDEADGPLDQEAADALLVTVEGLLDLSRPNVIVLSDYAKGTCSPAVCRMAIEWGFTNDAWVIVDPKGDWEKYQGADLVTPNQAEWDIARDRWSGAWDANVLVTQGARGMTFCAGEHAGLHIPAINPDPVDVAGAGDTVVATLAYALEQDHDLPIAARMANAAAGIVVGKKGTATCSLAELGEEWSMERIKRRAWS